MMETFRKKQHHLYYEPSLSQGITIGMTTRNGGKSAYPKHAFNMARYIDDVPEYITQHQEVLAHEIGFERAQWVFPIQTHEDKVIEIFAQNKGQNIQDLSKDVLYGVDGMYTYEKNILLTMCYADCVPVYFYSAKYHLIALAHAGWRGTVKQIVHRVITQFPYDLKELQVVIGPATSNSYEINEEILNQFKQLPIDEKRYIEQRGPDCYGIDLKYANHLLCEHYGVPAQNITMTEYTTTEHLDLFFSYRIEKGNTGRMLAFIGQK
ncbi:peptidoglycan editing factor PgeF [Staphylococcus felis]|uniref:peptidoglycan editing factor PgeF n=1 Tax=Staphylococcus felis TaxID=46127 RepID=UPI000E28B715|nr:peptidoglycan editing factor PgeF [Staphylococcus felis]REI14799.1 peptidoglycan editing factor PgeF [Staphylococcus felis]